MKKVFFLIACFAFFASEASAKHIHISREGSTDGSHYNKVTEHETWFKHSLYCKDAGAITCGFASITLIGGFDTEVVQNFVLKQVAGGKTQGQTVYNETVAVSWELFDAGVLDIEMTDEF